MRATQFRFDREFAVLFMVMLITGAGNTALQSVLPAIGRSLGVADSVIATVFSVSALLWVFSAPFWANRSDTSGRRAMVILGISGFTLSTALVAVILFAGLGGWVAPLWTMLAVIVARMIYGSFGSAAPPAAQAIVALRTTRQQRVKALTMLGSAFGLGTILGPALAPYLVMPEIGLAGPATIFAILGLITALAAWRWLPGDTGDRGEAGHGASVSYPSIGGAPAGASVTVATEGRSRTKLPLRDPRIWPWMLAGLIMGHGQAMTGAAMGFLVIDRLDLDVTLIATQQAIGLVLMSGAGASLLVQWGLIPMLNLNPRAMMIVGLAAAAFGLTATAYASSLYGIATAYAMSSIGCGFTRPSFTAGSSLAVGRALQSAVAGRVTSINGASFVLGPTIGVGLYELWRPLPFLVAGAVMALMIPYALRRLTASDHAASPSPDQ